MVASVERNREPGEGTGLPSMSRVGTTQDPLNLVNVCVNTVPAAGKGDDNEKGHRSALQSRKQTPEGQGWPGRRAGGTSGRTVLLGYVSTLSWGWTACALLQVQVVFSGST